MLCSKCFKEIKPGKEVQIKGSIFCQECAKEPFTNCYNCAKTIHWTDKFHKNFSETREKWGFLWLFSREKKDAKELIQCDECYQEWRKLKITGAKWLRAKGKIIFFLIGILMASSVELFFPKIAKRTHDNIFLFIFVFVLFYIILTLLEPAQEADAYGFKEYKKDKKKVTNQNKSKK